MKKVIAAMCSIIACASFMTSAVVSAKSETLDQIIKNMPEGTMILIGDIDGSEVIDVTDLTLCSLWLLGDVELEDSQKMCADTNMDAALNISDLANFGAYCAKKVPEGSVNMIGVRRGFSHKGIDRPTRPDDYEVPPTSDVTGEVDAQPSPTPTPVPTAVPNDGTDYSKVERDPEAIKSGFSGLREATEEQIAASKNQPDKD